MSNSGQKDANEKKTDTQQLFRFSCCNISQYQNYFSPMLASWTNCFAVRGLLPLERMAKASALLKSSASSISSPYSSARLRTISRYRSFSGLEKVMVSPNLADRLMVSCRVSFKCRSLPIRASMDSLTRCLRLLVA